MGKERKLSSKDEFLLTIMKLRLGLQTMDLAIRSNVLGWVALIYFFHGYGQWQSTSRHWFLSLILNLFLQHPQIVFNAVRAW